MNQLYSGLAELYFDLRRKNVDAVIVGSAVVKLLHAGKFDAAMDLIKEIRAALDK